jgi:hypothetical protein
LSALQSHFDAHARTHEIKFSWLDRNDIPLLAAYCFRTGCPAAASSEKGLRYNAIVYI